MSNPADIQPQPVELGACTDLELLAAILAEQRAQTALLGQIVKCCERLAVAAEPFRGFE